MVIWLASIVAVISQLNSLSVTLQSWSEDVPVTRIELPLLNDLKLCLPVNPATSITINVTISNVAIGLIVLMIDFIVVLCLWIDSCFNTTCPICSIFLIVLKYAHFDYNHHFDDI
jgi:hypothetical protein